MGFLGIGGGGREEGGDEGWVGGVEGFGMGEEVGWVGAAGEEGVEEWGGDFEGDCRGVGGGFCS